MTLFKTRQLATLIPSLLILISGCSSGLFSIYTIDIQQGNALDPEGVDKIQAGMSRDNVKRLLGAPVLTPVFDSDRWDYIYYLKEPDTDAKKQRVSVYFSANLVEKIERDL
jgi:outer membrane protein assembly factor BamE